MFYWKIGVDFDFEVKFNFDIVVGVDDLDIGEIFEGVLLLIVIFIDVNEDFIVFLENIIIMIFIRVDMFFWMKVVDILVVDDVLDENFFLFFGEDKDLFEIDGGELFF